MSLDWQIGKCKDWQELKDDANWEVTRAIIFECMIVGLSGVTAKNAQEFKVRSDFVRTLNPFARKLTLEEIERRIGLTTNVGNETWARFVKRHADGFRRDLLYTLERKEGDDAAAA
jgi:hypothetical protein